MSGVSMARATASVVIPSSWLVPGAGAAAERTARPYCARDAT